MVDKIVEQAKERSRHLPQGTRQAIMIDVRGQSIAPETIVEIRDLIVGESRGMVAEHDIGFIVD